MIICRLTICKECNSVVSGKMAVLVDVMGLVVMLLVVMVVVMSVCHVYCSGPVCRGCVRLWRHGTFVRMSRLQAPQIGARRGSPDHRPTPLISRVKGICRHIQESGHYRTNIYRHIGQHKPTLIWAIKRAD